MNLELTWKTAIIKGVSQGIGRSVVLAVAEEGVNVAICARGEGALEAAKKELLKKGM